MKVAVTGANGKVGSALISELPFNDFDVTSLDIELGFDATDYDQFVERTKGHDALIHLAWRDLNTDEIHPDNILMYRNAYEAAVANDIGLVIMGSSNHARKHTQRDQNGRIKYQDDAYEQPNNPYGAEKQRMEEMGREFAEKHKMKIVCVRIGNVNDADEPNGDVPTRWLSHRDLGALVSQALKAKFDPGHFEVMYGVSCQAVFDWSNTFGYEPQDAS